MRRHWQREPLLLRGAFPALRDPLSPREVMALSGSHDAVSRLTDVKGIAVVPFTTADVVRHPLVGRIVEAYEGPGR